MVRKHKLKQLLSDAWALRGKGKYTDARFLVEEAYGLCENEDYESLGRIFHIYMQFESDHDKPTQALELCKKSLGYYEKSKNPLKIAHATRHMADLETHLSMQTNAEQHYREAIQIYRAHTETPIGDLANALRAFAILLEKCGEIEEAIEIWQETKQLYMSCNLPEGVQEANQKLKALL